jgi:hypothetical protein
MKQNEKDELREQWLADINNKAPKQYPVLKGILIFLVVILVCITVIVSVLLIGLTNSIHSLSGTASNLFSAAGSQISATVKDNPELGMAALTNNMYSSDQRQAMLLTIAKQMSADGKVDLTFNANFTTLTKRHLERQNLSCIDEYDYYKITTKVTPVQQQPGWNYYNPNINNTAIYYTSTYVITGPSGQKETSEDNLILTEKMVDKGCITFHMEASSGQYYKCPKRNCAMKEVDDLTPGNFIPSNLQIRSLQASVNEKR